MFKLNDYIMKLIKEMIGEEADYKVRELALGWFSKGVLAEADLAEIDTLIEEKNSKEIENSSGVVEIPEENTEISDEPLILE
jgi:hypothetical protein